LTNLTYLALEKITGNDYLHYCAFFFVEQYTIIGHYN